MRTCARPSVDAAALCSSTVVAPPSLHSERQRNLMRCAPTCSQLGACTPQHGSQPRARARRGWLHSALAERAGAPARGVRTAASTAALYVPAAASSGRTSRRPGSATLSPAAGAARRASMCCAEHATCAVTRAVSGEAPPSPRRQTVPPSDWRQATKPCAAGLTGSGHAAPAACSTGRHAQCACYVRAGARRQTQHVYGGVPEGRLQCVAGRRARHRRRAVLEAGGACRRGAGRPRASSVPIVRPHHLVPACIRVRGRAAAVRALCTRVHVGRRLNRTERERTETRQFLRTCCLIDTRPPAPWRACSAAVRSTTLERQMHAVARKLKVSAAPASRSRHQQRKRPSVARRSAFKFTALLWPPARFSDGSGRPNRARAPSSACAGANVRERVRSGSFATSFALRSFVIVRLGSVRSRFAMADSQRSLVGRLKDDVTCLKSMWFAKGGGETHAERLDNFYKPQASECARPARRCSALSHAVSHLTTTSLVLPGARTPHAPDGFVRVADDKFRDRFLWGRRPMLAAVAARLSKQQGAVWIDLGGGTGVRGSPLAVMQSQVPRCNARCWSRSPARCGAPRRCSPGTAGRRTRPGPRRRRGRAPLQQATRVQENVLMMAEYTDLARFKAIYVVDLCHSLCEVARAKLSGPRFKNVHVVEADACTFSPDKLHVPADLITYSYSLSSAHPRAPPRGCAHSRRAIANTSCACARRVCDLLHAITRALPRGGGGPAPSVRSSLSALPPRCCGTPLPQETGAVVRP